MFKVIGKIISETDNNETKNVEVIVPLKYFSSFWRNLENTLINYESNLMLTWSANNIWYNTAVNKEAIFSITDTKLYFPVVTLSTQANKTIKIRIQIHNFSE